MMTYGLTWFQWLAKQADMKRILDIEDLNLTDEEKNPVWLCNKGKLVAGGEVSKGAGQVSKEAG